MGRRTLPPALSVFVRLAAWLSLAGVGWSQTTAPVFLPGYDESDWTALRGSIVASDESMTTYTIFCAQQTPPSCLLDDALPFSFAEGSSSLRFSGTMKGQITENLDCQLAGTTAATCTGYSSLGPGFQEGPFTGPMETTWTSTYRGSSIVWGVLTMTAAPSAAATANLDATAVDGTGSAPAPEATAPDGAVPTTSAAAGSREGGLESAMRLGVVFAFCGLVTGGVLF